MGPFTELALSGARQAIDRVDDAMVVLLAGRRALVSAIVRLKHDAGIPLRDASREWFVHRRAQRLAARLGVPPRSAAALMTFLIAEACRQQVLMDATTRRRVGIEVSDLGLRCVLEIDGDRVRIGRGPVEATVRGKAADLLLLASRLEDADTLFFQRRLTLTGDTELGLTMRNMLDGLPWETLPSGLRFALHHGGRLAQAMRA